MKQIKTPEGSFTIYLNRMDGDSIPLYHLSFIDKDNKVQIILMQHSEGQWTITNESTLPAWVLNLKQQLINLVKQEEGIVA